MPAKKRLVIGIAGGSGSGKTTLAQRMVEQSERFGIAGRIFSLDNYYKPLDHLPLAERPHVNFDHPDALDFALAADQLRRLRAGETVRQPRYDFKVHTRSKRTLSVPPTPLIVVEGIYALYPRELLELYDYKIFVSTGVATAVLRRMQRDLEERGRDVESSKHQLLTTVLPMYEAHIKPTQRNAHFLINWEGEEIPEKATEGLVRMVRDFFR